ncbi:MAG: carboxypeptidase regulatory-like domain-containing protein [Anaerolineales bacterium]|nr:carboxypeptidase regulatory-like domain-containing protein [Anaerolineales bacterium]
MDQPTQPGALAPLLPQGTYRRKKGKIWFYAIAGTLLSLALLGGFFLVTRAQIPALGNFFPTPIPDGAIVRGRAYFSDTGHPIRNTLVEIYDAYSDTLEASTHTDANGYYQLPVVDPGTYYVHILIPEEDIAACAEPRLARNSSWNVVGRVIDNVIVANTAGSVDFTARRGETITMNPPMLCR